MSSQYLPLQTNAQRGRRGREENSASNKREIFCRHTELMCFDTHVHLSLPTNVHFIQQNICWMCTVASFLGLAQLSFTCSTLTPFLSIFHSHVGRAWERGYTHVLCSLVPRPFPPPVFDRILYAKTEGEGLGERVTCVTSGRREGRH